MTFRDLSVQPQLVTVGLVNNMPDSAFIDTENQFRRVALGTDGVGIDFELYTIREIPRCEKVATVIEEAYSPDPVSRSTHE